MRYFDKMMKQPFTLINASFRDFKVGNRPSLKHRIIQIIQHAMVICLFILIEMLAVIFSDGPKNYMSYIPFYLFDIVFFYIAYLILLPFIFKHFRIFIIRLLFSSILVLLYSVLLQLLENFFKSLKTGTLELIFTIKHFHLSSARGMLLTTLAYIFYNSKYLINVEREIAERHSRELELKNDLLRAQLDPHLLNNVLTVLYGRIMLYSEIDAEILRLLSGLTSYSINQSDQNGNTSLISELKNIKDYIKIMELCKESTYDVIWNIQEANLQNVIMPPKILLEPVANALKYGISSSEKPIHIDLSVSDDNKLYFRVFNYIATNKDNILSSHTIGLANLKERLLVNFPGKYELEIKNNDNTFELTLIIQL